MLNAKFLAFSLQPLAFAFMSRIATIEPSTQPPPAPAKSRTSFGALTSKTSKTKTAYPVFPKEQNPQVYDLAERIVKRVTKIKAETALCDVDKADMRMLVAPFYYQTNHGKLEAPSSISIASSEEVICKFLNKYTQPVVPAIEPQLRHLIGDKFDTCFRQKFFIEIDGDKLPADKTQEIVDGLQALFAEHNALGAVAVKDELRPFPDFHARRLLEFTPEVNLAISEVYPSQINVEQARGRKQG